MSVKVGRATVRVVGKGISLTDGLAFVRIGAGDEVRVRWALKSARVRWRCDSHPGSQDCTHTRAVTWHISGVAMRSNPIREEDQHHEP